MSRELQIRKEEMESMRHTSDSSDSTSPNGTSKTTKTEERRGYVEKARDVERIERSGNDEDAPPDGGRDAWLVVLGVWCGSFCTFGWVNSIGTFQAYYEQTLLRDYTAAQIAWIPSFQIFFLFFMGPFVGVLFDRYGPRYMILAGSFLHVFGLMMASISTQYYQLMLSQGVCSALGVAFIFQPSISCIASWFAAKKGLAFGVLATGSSVGGVIFPIMITRMVRSVGYGWAMRTIAFMLLVLLGITNATVKNRVPPRPKPLGGKTLIKPFREVSTFFTIAGFLLLSFGIYVPINYLVTEAVAAGMGQVLSEYLVAIFNAASLFGRLFTGVLADRIGRFNTCIGACIVTGILILTLWIAKRSDAGTLAFTILFGFASGAYVSLTPALIAQISPPSEIGYRTGLLYMGGSFGGLTTSPIAGAILAREGGKYLGLKIFAGVFCLAGTALFAVVRARQTKGRLMARF